MLRTRAPRKLLPFRLACIRPAASVHPEPGSNSPSYVALPPPIAGRTCILNVCRSVDFIMLSNNFKELPPRAIPLAMWHPASMPSKRVAKVTPFSDSASVYLCFFFLVARDPLEKHPLSPRTRPVPSASGMQRYEHSSYSQHFLGKKSEEFEKKRQDAGIQQLQTESFFGKGEIIGVLDSLCLSKAQIMHEKPSRDGGSMA